MSTETWEPDRTDPGYIRRCVRPDCTATYNALDVMDGRAMLVVGWRIFSRVIIGQICPAHSAPCVSGRHTPAWLRLPDDDAIVGGIGCACGWTWWAPHLPAVQHEYQDQWVAHLISVDGH